MISSTYVMTQSQIGPVALLFLLFVFDYTPWTITNSESAVAWRSAFGSAYSGETHHCCARSMLGNSVMISRSRGHFSLENVNRADAGNESHRTSPSMAAPSVCNPRTEPHL
jgi:hypothetical protein